MKRMLLFVVSLVAPAVVSEVTQAADGTVRFNRDIRPILSDVCFQCHGPDERQRQAGLRLDREAAAKGTSDSGVNIIVPGSADASELFRRITHPESDQRMPPADSGKQLTPEQIERFRRWIEGGAEWEGHWSFRSPERSDPPTVANRDGLANPIDNFILAQLARQGLAPSPRADRATLLRRVTLDLTGLPPTLDELDAFLADESDGAWERVIDRLLESPRYGEHMARAWLDAARYGDTHGLHLDNERSIWPYRDWVINAFNRNMRFDQFTVEQLAGDLLPNATLDQRIATGFNRCNVTTSEGGAIAAEWLVRYAVDRVNTTSTVFMGLTSGCAQCHDHKFDPISQREFYQLFAYFYSLTEKAMDGNALLPPPVVRVPSPEQRRQQNEYQSGIASLRGKLRRHRANSIPAIAAWEKRLAAAGATLAPSDVLAHYPLDETAGLQVSGSGSATKPGRVIGRPEWVSGRFGNAFECDGATHIDLGDQAAFERTDQFSYGAWVKLTSNDAAGVIARMDDKAGFRGYDMYASGGRVYAHLIHQWAENAIRVGTREPVTLNEWHHVMVTYDGSSQAEGVSIYVDGVKQDLEVVYNSLSSTIKTARPLHIGRRNRGTPFKGIIDDVRIYARELPAAQVGRIAGAHLARQILAVTPDNRSAEQTQALADYYLKAYDADFARLSRQLTSDEHALTKLEATIPATLVMEDLPDRRKTFVLVRGEYDRPDKQQSVEPGVPDALPELPAGAPPNRLALARWLVDPDHPLTARVTVNRYWQRFFSTGIVKTSEDFGSQGQWPSHPELLDWLARDFIDSGWNIKALQKRIAMSATYQQSSRVTPDLQARDPENRLLARGPRFRIAAETIRDQALFLSGLMNPAIGGPSTKPYQPLGLWHTVGYTDSNTANFRQDHGDALYRRSMYIFWKRTSPPPTMAAFDAPSREECTVRRARTNTPLQALVLMNDIQFVEAARHLARRILARGGDSFDQRATFAFRTVTGRKPAPEEIDVLRKVFDVHVSEYRIDRQAALRLLSVGESERDELLDVAEHAAWTMISNLLLNLDEVITKN